MAEYQLKEEILKLSQSKAWTVAKLEWTLIAIYLSEEADTCPCGHYPIKEICRIKNNLNSNETDVGNCCVKKFLGLNAQKLFAPLKRLHGNSCASVNVELIEDAYQKRIIRENEYSFYIDILRKRNLSEKQASWKESINKKLLNHYFRSTKKPNRGSAGF